MSGLEDGKYLIAFSSFPSPPVGVERGSGSVAPVITEGSDNIRNDEYSIMLRNPGPRFTAIEGDKVVAPIILSSADPIEITPWNISGSDGGPYVISKPTDLVGVIQCWTVENAGPDQPVVLKSYPVVPGMELPQWNFIQVKE
ncbi:hypothetical protein HD554DRAFT_2169038 [Boletus coccyginus]|nr:hypothetical protein HD554DRAFT_2169038 [Boletus coccyginus]